MGSKKSTTTSSTRSYLPDWVTSAGKGIYDTASDYVSKTPYEDYGGERVAGETATWKQGRDIISNMAGGQNADYGAARTTLDSLTAANDPTKTTRDYMNPYIGAVLDPTLRNIREQRDRQENQLNSGAAMAGAFGDSSHGVQRGLLDRLTQQNIGDATGSAYKDAYDRAQSERDTVMSRLLGISGARQGLGAAEDSRKTSLAQLLAGFGTQEQTTQQKQDDINNQNFINRRNYPLEQQRYLAQLLGAVPYQTGSDGTSTTKTSDPSAIFDLIGKIIGSAASIAVPT